MDKLNKNAGIPAGKHVIIGVCKFIANYSYKFRKRKAEYACEASQGRRNNQRIREQFIDKESERHTPLISATKVTIAAIICTSKEETGIKLTFCH